MYEMIERESVESDSPSTKEISTGKNDLQKIFESATKEDLQDFILSCIKSMDGFRNRFLGHFCGLLEEDPMQQYRQIIRNYAKAAEGQYGFIDYSSARTLIRPLWELNKKADTLRENGEVRESMELSQILIEEMVGLYQNIDDSGGGAGQVVMQAFNTLESIAKNASATIKEDLFEWSMQEFSLQKYHDFGFERNFLDLLPLLVSSAEQEERFLALLDRQIEREKENQWSDYAIMRLIKAKITYFRTQARNQKVLKLLKTHSRFPDFREQLVDRALENDNCDLAKELCNKGIEIAKK